MIQMMIVNLELEVQKNLLLIIKILSSDGREILKYGTNPLDNDTDWDMLPDWYEYALAWNESLDNFSSQRYISVEWVDVGAEESIQKPLKTDGTKHNATHYHWLGLLRSRDPTDALLDPIMMVIGIVVSCMRI